MVILGCFHKDPYFARLYARVPHFMNFHILPKALLASEGLGSLVWVRHTADGANPALLHVTKNWQLFLHAEFYQPTLFSIKQRPLWEPDTYKLAATFKAKTYISAQNYSAVPSICTACSPKLSIPISLPDNLKTRALNVQTSKQP